MGKIKKNNKVVNANSIAQKYELMIKQLKEEHEKEKEKIITEYEELLHYNMKNIIDTMQTEFIYELASQMNYWNIADKYTKDSAKYRIEEINKNIFKTIDGYSKMRDDKQVQKVFKYKKSKIKNEFNLKVEE